MIALPINSARMRRLVAVVAALALVLTACVQTIAGRPTAPSDLAWQRNIIDAVASLGSALGPVGDAMIDGDYPAIREHCTTLKTAIDRIESQLPAPDAAVDDALQEGVDNYRWFAELCVTITPDSSASEFNRLNTYLERGDARIRDALALMGIDLPGR